jgi:exopolyphosphatase / guanosine-5'-triphosphate,3'-diphosphate pyrophosphatase
MASEASTSEPTIVPRWEWRTFGGELGPAEEALAAHAPKSVHDSDEIYLLSVGSEDSVKLRDDLMDVKQLLRVSDEGLQLWIPVMKAAFPLSADDVTSVLTALDVAVPALERASYPANAFATELIQANPELLAVRVHKHRVRYVIDECMLELTDIRAGDAPTRTIAIESPDATLVSTTIHILGLDGRPNVSVPRGLKTLVGFGRFAVIDVGTNSVKFHLGEHRADGAVVTVADRAEITRLGEGQGESGELDPRAINRTVDAIDAMVGDARQRGAAAIVAVGTAGLRRAPNRDRLVDAVQARCGVTVEVISGEDEARLAYVAATSALPSAQGRLVVFDSGGGSTQFTFGQDRNVDEQFSLDVGAVRVAERFGLDAAVSKETLGAALAALAAQLDRLDARPRPDAVVAIGGTATTLAAVKHGLARYDAAVVHGTVLDVAEVDRQIERYRTRTASERREIVGLQPARAEVILGGACIVRTILTKLQHDSLTVSDRGLRHGVFLERFAP